MGGSLADAQVGQSDRAIARDADGRIGRLWAPALGPLAIAVLGGLALWRAWPYGPDPQVDFGRELYLPWRVAEGARLYVDLEHFSGPLSVTLHAALFALMDAGLQIIQVANAVVVGGIACFSFAIARREGDALTATAVTLFFVGALAFAQLTPIANYDYLTPYSHELTHGLLLSLVALWVFGLRETSSPVRGAGAGVLLGLASATKLEVFVALAAAWIVRLACEALVRDREGAVREAARVGIASGLAFLVTLASMFVALLLQAGAGTAIGAVVEPLRVAFATDVARLPYYRWVMGTLEPVENLRVLGLATGVYLVLGFTLHAASLAWRRGGLERFTPIAGVLFAAAAIAFPLAPRFAVDAARPLPLVLACALAVCAMRFHTSRTTAEVSRIGILVFGLVLQAKLLLHARFAHYGFVLCMPGALVLVFMLVREWPRWVEAHGGSGRFVRVAALAGILALGLGLDARTSAMRERRTEPLGTGNDAFLADARGREVRAALDQLDSLPPQATVAVLPEGVMLNYLSRRVNPTRFVNFMPPEFSMYGEDAIVDAFVGNPPDVVLFVHKHTGLYGAPFFGRDYGRALHGWVLAHYRPVATFGGTPFEARTRFGIRVFERIPGS